MVNPTQFTPAKGFAVADRFGLWGIYGQPNVSWGNHSRFVDYAAMLNWFLPAAIIPALAMIATFAATLFGLLLVLGWNTRVVALLSGALPTSFALTMTVTLGVKAPLTFSSTMRCQRPASAVANHHDSANDGAALLALLHLCDRLFPSAALAIPDIRF